ncbi:hypothetical protein A9Q73_01450 [Bermanella sp. 47_1433_sub80_T6]|nr:hypothetical protein A9Q73_01450 [Bermanella sp. 47_1433_sub80_T6]
MLTKIFTVILLICSSVSIWALEPINGSYQKHYSNERKQNHWLILGAIERIKGAVKPESELRVDAKVRSWLWQIPVGLSSEQAFVQIKSQVEQDASVLFECEGRSCGLSNDYANQVFQQAILYGRDSDQYYWLGLKQGKADNQKKTLWLVYSIQRSNKRVYVYVEKIDLPSSQAGRFDEYVKKGDQQTLIKQGYLTVAQLPTEQASLSLDQIEWLKQVLHDNPNKKFALVVHRYGGQDQQALVEGSALQAQGLLDQLAQAGAFIKNVYSHGAGAMLPRPGGVDRIELVMLDAP